MEGTARSSGRVEAWVDVAVASTTLVATAYLCLRAIPPERSEWLNSPAARVAVYGTVAFVIALGLVYTHRRRSLLARMRLRAPLYGLGALLTLMGVQRVRVDTDWHWPLHPRDSMASRTDELSPSERVEWAARLALHRVSTQSSESLLTIPRDWSFPADVMISVQRGVADTVRVWARAADGTTDCIAVPYEGMHADPSMNAAPKSAIPSQVSPVRTPPAALSTSGCGESVAPPAAATFVRPPRVTDTPVIPALTMVGAPWTEYRGDARKSSTSSATPSVAPWRNHLDGEVRSSISVVGKFVLIGAHGSGTLGAFDLADGHLIWSSRLPNWIHQDAVSDGRIVVVGFGDNDRSFFGRTPSGVAAYAVASGQHLWTRFDESSVMTSPVVRDSFIVYGTSSGVVRKRSLLTGALLAEKELPGGVFMAPPASVGDTVVFSLDLGGVCALLMSSLDTIWCRTLPFHRETGHSAPTIADGTVIASGTLLARAISPREFLSLPRALQLGLLHTIVTPQETIAGQRFSAFRVRDGAPLWNSRIFQRRRKVEGHPSGTASIRDSLGVIVMPLDDSIAGFDVRTGRVLWTANAHLSRGPPLLLGDVVVNAGHDGTTDIRELTTGRLRCTMTRTTGYDRAGPTVAGGLVLFADLHGDLEAVPKAALLACDSLALHAVSLPRRGD